MISLPFDESETLMCMYRPAAVFAQMLVEKELILEVIEFHHDGD